MTTTAPTVVLQNFVHLLWWLVSDAGFHRMQNGSSWQECNIQSEMVSCEEECVKRQQENKSLAFKLHVVTKGQHIQATIILVDTTK